jgi:hypothetical protein
MPMCWSKAMDRDAGNASMSVLYTYRGGVGGMGEFVEAIQAIGVDECATGCACLSDVTHEKPPRKTPIYIQLAEKWASEAYDLSRIGCFGGEANFEG